ncbi:hypothetical protein BGX33_005152 [Mortierella sp. NVP41]|nr:hypothetical protein BGX33_005152 [Mortierella sp. NVP41]
MFRISKRQGPRRLAGDKRDGLLDNIVDKLAQPPSTTDPKSDDPSPSPVIEPTDSGSDPEPSATTTGDNPEPTPAPDDEDNKEENKDEEHEEESTPSSTPSDEATATSEEPTPTTTADLTPEPTDPSTTTSSGDDTTITSTSTSTSASSRDQPSTQTDPTVTKSSKGEDVGPTILPHKEESTGSNMALTIGVVAAAVVIAAVGIWIFRKWKLSPSRLFKSKIAGRGGAGAGGAGAAVYGAGHDDHSEYNSCTEIFRPAADYESSPTQAQPPMSAISTPTYPAAVAVAGGCHGYDGSEYGYNPYQQQQQYGATESMGDNYQCGYESGATPVSDASAMRAPVVVNPNPVVGGVPATGHNIHGYGSEDFSQNNAFLRELRE